MIITAPNAPPLSGIMTAILTPLHPDLSIDINRLVTHARDLLARGGSRVSTFGSTGEGVAFTSDEKRAAVEALLQADIQSHHLLPAIMSPSVGVAAQEMMDLVSLGCSDILMLPPYFYKNPSLEGLVSFYDAVCARAGSPNIRIVLYNIPQMTGVTITHDLVRALQERLGTIIAGVKDSTGNIASGLAYVSAFPDLAIFTGDDRVLPRLLRAGGAGIIGGLPNLYVDDLVALYNDPEGPKAEELAALAAERIADIDREGGLLALKYRLAARTGDDAWRRAMPPLDGDFRRSASA